MSYDLQVFGRNELTREQLRALVADAGFDVDDQSVGDALTVLRGARRAYSFTLATPVPIELEDVPEEVTSSLLAPRYFYEALVEGSSPTEIPHAVRFARRLAEAAGGVVLDQQLGQIWKRGKLRTTPRVEKGVIATVDVRWYCRPTDDPGAAALAWTELARRWMPELRPRRYGTFEPLQQKYDEGGDEAFADFVRAADGMVFFKTSQPALDGHVAAGDKQGIHTHSVAFLRDALAEPPWRAALEGFFTEFAVRTRAVLATAEVIRGVHWSGRSASHSGHTEVSTYLSARGAWAGLPPTPVWWTFFGSEYVPLVSDHLAPDRVRRVGDGLFHRRVDAPADRDELSAALAPVGSPARRSLFRRVQTSSERQSWLPHEMLAVVDRSDPRLHNPPLTPALVRPKELG